MSAPAFQFGSFCSGIEAASEAFLPLGAECAYVAEIEPYPCGVLAVRHGAGRPLRVPRPEEAATEDDRKERAARIKTLDRFPMWGGRLTNYGDLTQIDPEELPFVDLLAAGTPCQAFSIAGLRQSLADSRGNLTLHFVKVVHELVRLGRLRSILWENVPDVLNTRDNAFGAFLAAIVGHDEPIPPPLRRRKPDGDRQSDLFGAEPEGTVGDDAAVDDAVGGAWPNAGVAHGPLGTAAWRVLDAQYAGLAQRRERVFLVASFGDGPDPVEVLFERQGLSRDPPARRQAGEGIARPLAAGSPSSGGYRNDADTADNLVAGTLTGRAGNSSRPAGSNGNLVAGAQRRAAFGGNNTSGELEVHTALTASHTASGRQDFETEAFIVEPVAFDPKTALAPHGSAVGSETAYPLKATGHKDQQLVAFNARQDPDVSGDVTGPLDTDGQTQAIAFSCKDHGADAGELSPTLRSMGHAVSHPNAGGQVAVVYPLAEPDAGWNGNGTGVGGADDPCPTLQAGKVHAVAFSMRGREGGAMPEAEPDDIAPGLRAAEGGSTRPFVAFGISTDALDRSGEGAGGSAAERSGLGISEELSPTLRAKRPNAVACATGEVTHTLTAEGFDASEDGTGRGPPLASDGMAVRRITCVEGERLQGFRDNYTLIPWPTGNRKGEDLEETVAYLIGHGFSPEQAAVLAQTPDGPRYKGIGNSKAVPLVRKLGARYAAALQRYLATKAVA